MSYRRIVLGQLAEAILTGEQSEAGIRASIAWCLGIAEHNAKGIAQEVIQAFDFPYQGRNATALARFLAQSPTLIELSQKSRLRLYRWPVKAFHPHTPLIERFNLPQWPDLASLGLWCQLSPGDLDWYSQRFLHQNTHKLQHYHYHTLPKSNGALRLLETPKQRLKWIQGKLNQELLNKIPLHQSAHGFVAKRSVLTHSENHVGKPWIISLDLEHFFLSVNAGRVTNVFRTLGYSNTVAKALTGLCLNSTPEDQIHKLPNPKEKALYRAAHLPQGAPSSPALANLCAFNLDCRLAGAARWMGYEYSRYADDLVFSNHEKPTAQHINQFVKMLNTIIRSEGFCINQRKTRFMTQAQRQQITGIVVNEKRNISRKQLKQLEAILYNCVRHGPTSQNKSGHPRFQQHLRGKLTYYSQVNPERCRKLWQLYDQIQWPINPAPTSGANQ